MNILLAKKTISVCVCVWEEGCLKLSMEIDKMKKKDWLAMKALSVLKTTVQAVCKGNHPKETVSSVVFETV